MPGVVIIVPQGPSAATARLAAVLSRELLAQGMPAPVQEGAAPPPSPGQVVVSVGTRARLGCDGGHGLGGEGALRRTILIDEASPGCDGGDELLTLARGSGALFALDEGSARRWRAHGVGAQLLALGYSADEDVSDADGRRPHDIVALGAPTPRRVRWRRGAERVLSRHRTSVWAQARPPSLAGARIALNVHGADADRRLSWLDILPAVHAGAVLVSEHATGLEPLVPGRHLLVADASALAWVAEGLLADSDRLAQMRADAVRRIEGWRPLALGVSALRIAVVQLAARA